MNWVHDCESIMVQGCIVSVAPGDCYGEEKWADGMVWCGYGKLQYSWRSDRRLNKASSQGLGWKNIESFFWTWVRWAMIYSMAEVTTASVF
ncbi:conserved hypothetical protein [Ricinus communis]|uniref:Uncharacterized protein n=1 Tax=Ricinus communis TaxID=3988 RepID=B9RRT7_RICCO|nr:conserved hypothetical protein [Ricinus communis]